WYFNSLPLADATNALLSLVVQTNSGGAYSVTVTNVAGSTNSLSVVLTIEPAYWSWARKMGGGADDEATAVAFNERGEAIVAGFVRTNITPGVSNTVTPTDQSDIILARYDRQGNLLWSMRDGWVGNE